MFYDIIYGMIGKLRLCCNLVVSLLLLPPSVFEDPLSNICLPEVILQR